MSKTEWGIQIGHSGPRLEQAFLSKEEADRYVRALLRDEETDRTSWVKTFGGYVRLSSIDELQVSEFISFR